MNKRNNQLMILVSCALLIAMNVVLVRFCSITTTYLRLSFGFIPLAIAAMMFGPGYACAVGAIADLLGAILFPSGPFWPGFTIVAGLCGLIYGFLLYQKPGSHWSRPVLLIRVLLTVLLINVVMELGLNTGNLYLMYGEGVMAWVPGRITKAICMIPVEFIMINFMRRALVEPMQRRMK